MTGRYVRQYAFGNWRVLDTDTGRYVYTARRDECTISKTKTRLLAAFFNTGKLALLID